MDINFNPIAFAFEVVETVHPNLVYTFDFAYLGDESISPKDYKGPWGHAVFNDDGSKDIVIDPRLPIVAFPEILMHEVAHLISGFDSEHNEAWDREFENLHIEYHKMFEERFGQDQV